MGTAGGNASSGPGTAANPTPGGLFGAPKQAASTGGGIFGGANTASTSTAPQTGANLFDGGLKNSTSTPGGLFSGANNPNPPTSNTGTGLFGGSKASTPAPSFGTGLFSGAGSTTAPTTGSIFGMPSPSNASAHNTTSAPVASSNSLFTAFSLPKAGDTAAQSTKPVASGC